MRKQLTVSSMDQHIPFRQLEGTICRRGGMGVGNTDDACLARIVVDDRLGQHNNASYRV